MDLYGKEVSFEGHHFPGAVEISGRYILSVKVLEACEYDSKLMSFLDYMILIISMYIYMYRILEILSCYLLFVVLL